MDMFIISRIRKYIPEFINESQTVKHKRQINVINMDSVYNVLLDKFKKISLAKIDLIKEVKKTTPRYVKFEAATSRLANISKEIEKLYTTMKKENVNTLALTEIYAAYLLLIVNNVDKAVHVNTRFLYYMNRHEGLKKQFFNIDSSLSTVIISGNLDNLGTIIDVNNEMPKKWRSRKKNFIGKKVEELMPNFYARHHKDFIMKYYKHGTVRMIDHPRIIYIRRSDNFIEECNITLRVSPDLAHGVTIAGIVIGSNHNDEVLESIGIGILIVEEYSGKIEYVNRIANKKYGFVRFDETSPSEDMLSEEFVNMKFISPEFTTIQHNKQYRRLKDGTMIRFKKKYLKTDQEMAEKHESLSSNHTERKLKTSKSDIESKEGLYQESSKPEERKESQASISMIPQTYMMNSRSIGDTSKDVTYPSQNNTLPNKLNIYSSESLPKDISEWNENQTGQMPQVEEQNFLNLGTNSKKNNIFIKNEDYVLLTVRLKNFEHFDTDKKYLILYVQQTKDNINQADSENKETISKEQNYYDLVDVINKNSDISHHNKPSNITCTNKSPGNSEIVDTQMLVSASYRTEDIDKFKERMENINPFENKKQRHSMIYNETYIFSQRNKNVNMCDTKVKDENTPSKKSDGNTSELVHKKQNYDDIKSIGHSLYENRLNPDKFHSFDQYIKSPTKESVSGRNIPKSTGDRFPKISKAKEKNEDNDKKVSIYADKKNKEISSNSHPKPKRKKTDSQGHLNRYSDSNYEGPVIEADSLYDKYFGKDSASIKPEYFESNNLKNKKSYDDFLIRNEIVPLDDSNKKNNEENLEREDDDDSDDDELKEVSELDSYSQHMNSIYDKSREYQYFEKITSNNRLCISQFFKNHRNFYLNMEKNPKETRTISHNLTKVLKTHNSPVFLKLFIFVIQLFLSMITVLGFQFFTRTSYESIFNQNTDALYFGSNTLIYFPKIDNDARFLELIASGVIFADNKIDLFTEKKRTFVQHIYDFNHNSFETSSIIDYLNRREEIQTQNYTLWKETKYGRTYYTRNGLFNSYSEYISRGYIIETSSMDSQANVTSSDGVVSTQRNSFNYIINNGYNVLVNASYTQILNYQQSADNDVTNMKISVTIIFVLNLIIIAGAIIGVIYLLMISVELNVQVIMLYMKMTQKEIMTMYLFGQLFMVTYFDTSRYQSKKSINNFKDKIKIQFDKNELDSQLSINREYESMENEDDMNAKFIKYPNLLFNDFGNQNVLKEDKKNIVSIRPVRPNDQSINYAQESKDKNYLTMRSENKNLDEKNLGIETNKNTVNALKHMRKQFSLHKISEKSSSLVIETQQNSLVSELKVFKNDNENNLLKQQRINSINSNSQASDYKKTSSDFIDNSGKSKIEDHKITPQNIRLSDHTDTDQILKDDKKNDIKNESNELIQQLCQSDKYSNKQQIVKVETLSQENSESQFGNSKKPIPSKFVYDDNHLIEKGSLKLSGSDPKSDWKSSIKSAIQEEILEEEKAESQEKKRSLGEQISCKSSNKRPPLFKCNTVSNHDTPRLRSSKNPVDSKERQDKEANETYLQPEVQMTPNFISNANDDIINPKRDISFYKEENKVKSEVDPESSNEVDPESSNEVDPESSNDIDPESSNGEEWKSKEEKNIMPINKDNSEKTPFTKSDLIPEQKTSKLQTNYDQQLITEVDQICITTTEGPLMTQPNIVMTHTDDFKAEPNMIMETNFDILDTKHSVLINTEMNFDTEQNMITQPNEMPIYENKKRTISNQNARKNTKKIPKHSNITGYTTSDSNYNQLSIIDANKEEIPKSVSLEDMNDEPVVVSQKDPSDEQSSNRKNWISGMIKRIKNTYKNKGQDLESDNYQKSNLAKKNINKLNSMQNYVKPNGSENSLGNKNEFYNTKNKKPTRSLKKSMNKNKVSQLPQCTIEDYYNDLESMRLKTCVLDIKQPEMSTTKNREITQNLTMDPKYERPSEYVHVVRVNQRKKENIKVTLDSKKVKDDEHSVKNKLNLYRIDSKKSVYWISIKVLIFIVAILCVCCFDFVVVFGMTAQVKNINNTFVKLLNMQYTINSMYSLAFETIARKVDVQYINGEDYFSTKYPVFQIDKGVIDLFTEELYTSVYTEYDSTYKNFMYNSLCTYIKTKSDFTDSSADICGTNQVYEYSLSTVINQIAKNTNFYLTLMKNSVDKDAKRKEILESDDFDVQFHLTEISNAALTYTNNLFLVATKKFSKWIIYYTYITSLSSILLLISMITFLVYERLKALDHEWTKLLLLIEMIPKDVFNNNQTVRNPFKAEGFFSYL